MPTLRGMRSPWLVLLLLASRPAAADERPAPVSASDPAPAATDDSSADPFAFGDFTWLNGSNRQKTSLLDTNYFTGSALLDSSYVYDFNRPIDDTIVGSTVALRHNEFNIVMASLGGDFHWQHVRATLTAQLGQRPVVLSSGDPSQNHGQFELASAFRYIREANAGYHWDVLHGLNVDLGLFMAYLGLSYLSFENWSYQPPYVSDATPYYFQGVRAQLFPSDRLKIELWLVNGWQTYGVVNRSPAVGYQLLWRPSEAWSLTSNGYLGYDAPQAVGRLRLHSDNNLQWRYYQNLGRFFTRAAISLILDAGCEDGDGVSCGGSPTAPQQSFLGGALYHRIWFAGDLLAFTLGLGGVSSPGRYLEPAVPGTNGPSAFPQTPGTTFDAWDATATFDYMPHDLVTFRLEFNHRAADVKYFAGAGGVTSPDGYTTSSTVAFVPDLRHDENRLALALLFRM